MNQNKYAAVVAIVERGKADHLVEAARKAGATGATVFFARGTGTDEHLSFFRLQVDAMKEVALILAPQTHVEEILSAVTAAGELSEPGKGIVFTLPVGEIIGLDYLWNF
ncbi:P-II family nitrogen regulator [Pontiellaceae bacterium B12219]|nr:P-II family nitrogen regulator [Pontiellaceae bacterium B12219]